MKQFETVDAKTKHWHNIKPGDKCEPLTLTVGEYMLEAKGDFSGAELTMKFGFKDPDFDIWSTETSELSEVIKMPNGVWMPVLDGDKDAEVTLTIRKLEG